MAAKAHKSLRIDNDLVERVNALREGNEPFSNALCRVLAVGCEALERGTDEPQPEHGVAQLEHDESTARLISTLEQEAERLRAEHEADRRAIAEKDAQLAAALAKAHDLAEQAHVLMGRELAGQLPKADDGGEIVEVKPIPEKIGFWDWWRNYR